ncbi:MAG TPA: hypothetical protein VEU47_16625 [Candidatus Cybelea sp.]|nr:hypothetical protein [Candidatus Cybelea sp.]
MGDVVGLVEKVQATIDKAEADKLAAKLAKGGFDLEDLAQQLKQMRKMGGMSGVLGLLPGVAKVKQAMAQGQVDEGMLTRQEAIISSMTRFERRNPKLIQASRKRRIASGSGTSVQDVNRLLKQYMQMAEMMKRMQKLGQKGFMRAGIPGLIPPR